MTNEIWPPRNPPPMDRAWGEIAEAVRHGGMSAPRGQVTRELLGVSGRFDMSAPVLICPTRKLNYDFMCDEALWMLSGSNSVTDIPYAFLERFSDNGEIYSGAYGPHIVRQLPYVIRTLQNDEHSRQAVINIWQERPESSKDIPCTLSMQFIVRNGVLHMVVNMRSSDIFLGLPYDVFNFSMIGTYVAISLGHLVGNLYWNAGSAHIYDRDMDKLVACLEDLNHPKWFTPFSELDTTDALLDRLRDRRMARGESNEC